MKIARDTHGYVGADLAALCSEAAMNQIKDLAEQLGPAHLDQARDKLPGVTQKSFEVCFLFFVFSFLKLFMSRMLWQRQMHQDYVKWPLKCQMLIGKILVDLKISKAC